MKGVQNSWEETPKVRVSAIRYNQPPTKYMAFTNWPIPETQHKTLFLSQDRSLQLTKGASSPASHVSYQSDLVSQQVDNDPDNTYVEFVHTFTEASTLIGPSKAVLYVSCADHDDMDIFVILRKADANGKILRNVNIPLDELGLSSDEQVEKINPLVYVGASGILRASHLTIDPKLSKPHWPAHDHTREEKIAPGDVVKMEIGIWAAAIRFEAGEKLVFRVAGHQMTLAEFPPLRGGFKTGNKGRHTVHYGGQYDSCIIVPFVAV